MGTKKEEEYEFDEQNPEWIHQLTWTEVLLKIANGKVDALALVKQELINRGVDNEGEWIGFPEAEKFWSLR